MSEQIHCSLLPLLSCIDTSMLGESLGIITEKRISELEDELNELRSTWTHPDINQALKDELSQISQMKDKFEVREADYKMFLVFM